MPLKDISSEEQANLYMPGRVSSESVKFTAADKGKNNYLSKC